MEIKYYAGIGSRSTPPDVLKIMIAEARRLAKLGWTLRSGHAAGADRAFEEGAGGRAVVFLPWEGFGTRRYGEDPGVPVLGKAVCDREEWFANYKKLVAAGVRQPGNVPESHQLLHGRNYAQVRGYGREPDSRFVLYWAEEVGGEPQGGTATAVRLAKVLGVSAFNLLHEEVRRRVEGKHQ